MMNSDIFESAPSSLRDRTFDFPEYGILPFKPSELDDEEMHHVLYQLEDKNKELRILLTQVFNVA